MTSIGLISDTHSYLDPQLISILLTCDEIWHAGDFGNISVYEELKSLNKNLRSVFGNIDGNDLRRLMTEDLCWEVEGVKILMTHIGGYPGKYPSRIRLLLKENKPGIFVCGHSHILKVIYDKEFKLLHLNPGASGKEGFHAIRTALRFKIDQGNILDMSVIELGKR